MKPDIRSVFLVDLLALAPFYDRYLVEALAERVPAVRFYASAFPYEPTYWERTRISRAPGLIDRVAHMGLQSKAVRRALQLGEYTANWMKLLIDVRQQAPDVVHVQWLPLLEVTAVELWAIEQLQRTRTAVVYTAHNALPHDSGSVLRARYARAYSVMDRIIVHTESERARLVAELGVAHDRIDVVPHGPLLGDLSPVDRAEARASLGLAADDEVVLFLGLLRAYKGIEDLLNAVAPLLQRRPRARIVIAGQGEARYVQSLRALIERMPFADRVLLVDRYVSVDELPRFYASADVAVLPYRSASQSGALFTAASFTVPLVATEVGGIAEVLRGTDRAVLVPPADAVALAAAIADLLASPQAERLAMAQRLHAWAHDDCAWSRIAERTIESYARAVAQRGVVA